jgi:signal transduction histidine kinase
MKTQDEKVPFMSKILIVDDVADNLIVLGNMLNTEGYTIRPVLDGSLALQVAETEKPDLVLLDIMMPIMDGFEVCNFLKAAPNLKDVPVIFISALNDTDNIVKALTMGGVDYITKPFKVEEVKARVSTHLEISRQRKELELQRKELLLQKKDLLDVIATKNKFFSIITNDLRGPLSGFMGLTEILADEFGMFSQDEQKEIMSDMSRSARNMYNLLENLLEWTQLQMGNIKFEPQILSIKNVAAECLQAATESARKKDIEVITDLQAELEVYADKNMLQGVIRNLVSNAIKFTHKGGKIAISAGLEDGNMLGISVKDTGIGMTEQMLDNLFQIGVNIKRFGTEGELSTGLGLLLCKEFVEKLGGTIRISSVPNKGSDFQFTIPSGFIAE